MLTADECSSMSPYVEPTPPNASAVCLSGQDILLLIAFLIFFLLHVTYKLQIICKNEFSCTAGNIHHLTVQHNLIYEF